MNYALSMSWDLTAEALTTWQKAHKSTNIKQIVDEYLSMSPNIKIACDIVVLNSLMSKQVP